MLVPVQNQEGSPLSPCHPARARILPREQKATVVTVYPFVIRLTYQVAQPSFAPTRVGLDDGKTTVGLAVVQETAVANVALRPWPAIRSRISTGNASWSWMLTLRLVQPFRRLRVW